METTREYKTKSSKRKSRKAAKKREAEYRDPLNTYVRKEIKAKARQERAKEQKDKQSVYTAKVTKNDVIAGNLQPAITIEVPLDPNTLYGISVAYVSAALGRGWLSRTPQPNYPYSAAVYGLQVLISFVQASTPAASQIPKWMLCLCHALKPKTVRCQQGLASYSFNLGVTASPYVPPPNINLNSEPYGYEHLLYQVGGSPSVNGFPRAVSPGAYNEDVGRTAWSSLIVFMTREDDPMSTVVPATDTTTWVTNVSAFAMPQNAEGVGWNNSGGLAYQAGLEVPIHTPLLAVFANFLSNGSINPVRYGLFTNVGSGDALWAATQFFQLRHKNSNLGTKKHTKFHSIDFLRFADTGAIYAQKLLQTALKDNSFAPTVTPTIVDDIQCPLSLQEFQLLLRNEIAYTYVDTQVGCQAIYPRGVSGSSENEFVPFIMSSSTIPLSSVGMKLPIMLTENVKSLTGRWVEAKKIQPSFFCPVLGQYQADRLDSSNYTFEYQGSTYPVFRQQSTYEVKKKTKAGEVWEAIAEIPVDLIDGSAASDYLFINDLEQLQRLATLWNEWVDRLSAYSMTLTVLSKDSGVNICCSVGMTEHWIPKPPAMLAREAEVRDIRMVKRKELSSTVYSNRVSVAVSSHDRIYDSVFNMISKLWVLPSNKAVAGLTNNSQTPFQRMQIMMGETFSVTFSSQDGGNEISEKNANYASLMVRGPTAATSEVEEFFKKQAEKGTGGILSGLAAGFLGKAFGPTVGSIAGTVAEILPI